MLRVRSIESGYGKLRVLKGISLHVNRGEIVTIIGANGAGKTTLLGTIAGLIKAESGTILFDAQDITDQRTERIISLGCSLVPEGRQLFSTMAVKENLLLGAYATRRRDSRPSVAAGLQGVYELFPILAERQNQLAGTLSGGEQQMLAIARSLMSQPSLVMMDEPSMGLAPLIVRDILRVISTLRDEGKTILLVEQNARAALGVADRGYVMETGSIVLEGTSEELLDNRDVQRAYLGKDYKRIND